MYLREKRKVYTLPILSASHWVNRPRHSALEVWIGLNGVGIELLVPPKRRVQKIHILNLRLVVSLVQLSEVLAEH